MHYKYVQNSTCSGGYKAKGQGSGRLSVLLELSHWAEFPVGMQSQSLNSPLGVRIRTPHTEFSMLIPKMYVAVFLLLESPSFSLAFTCLLQSCALCFKPYGAAIWEISFLTFPWRILASRSCWQISWQPLQGNLQNEGKRFALAESSFNTDTSPMCCLPFFPYSFCTHTERTYFHSDRNMVISMFLGDVVTYCHPKQTSTSTESALKDFCLLFSKLVLLNCQQLRLWRAFPHFLSFPLLPSSTSVCAHTHKHVLKHAIRPSES